MRIKRKVGDCLNCGYSLNKVYNHCPNCGQENRNDNVSFRILTKDFVSNYLSLDSKFGRSIRPFFFSPGFLTQKYIEGKRVSYAHPVRLYILASLFYFFIVAQVGQISLNEKMEDAMEEELTHNDPEQENARINADSSDFIIDRLDEDLIQSLKNERKFSDQDILDSMKLGEFSYFERLVSLQYIRVERADEAYVMAHIFKNLPLAMLSLVPVYALLLKVLYIRRKHQLYIKHLVHSLHLHSFSFILFGISLLLTSYIITHDTIDSIIIALSFVLVCTYIYISFLKFYKQHWLKTLIKFNLAGSVYVVVICIFLATEMIVSLLLF